MNEKTKGVVLLLIGLAAVSIMLLIGTLLKDQGGLRGALQGGSFLVSIPLLVVGYYGLHKGIDILFKKESKR
ncbi:MAG: hypothetical protein L0387_43890 [Acidobacteria bacterium]|nr:hypothetical protein [Acidobacteriota bacterium]MCI0722157.1 hypothetical protein [Acidobacteriota bacterium]